MHATFVTDSFFSNQNKKLQCTAALIQIVFFQSAVNTVETLYTRETVKSEETEAIVKISETVKIVETAETVDIVETEENVEILWRLQRL